MLRRRLFNIFQSLWTALRRAARNGSVANPLEDDRRYFPPYDAVPVVRQAILQKYPALRAVLKQLGGILTVDEMRWLNFAVDGEKRQAKDVAREVLRGKGLVL